MHQCRSVHHNLYKIPPCSYSCSCSSSCSAPIYSSYEFLEHSPICESHCCSNTSCCHDYSPTHHGRSRCLDCFPRGPIVQTNIKNDICCHHHHDEPDEIYDDDYGNAYRLSRSRVQLVDIKHCNRAQRSAKPMVISAFHSNDRETLEHVVDPRSRIVRNTSVPTYERRKPVKLMPLYRSAEPTRYVTRRGHRASGFRELVPLATYADSHPKRQTIRVRSLSPLD